MQPADITTDTVIYAVSPLSPDAPGATPRRGVVLDVERWRRIRGDDGDVYQPVAAYHGPPIKSLHLGLPVVEATNDYGCVVSDAELLDAAASVAVMLREERPVRLPIGLALCPRHHRDIWHTWVEETERAASRRATAQRAQDGQRAEREVQEAAQDRVRALVGPRRWDAALPPSRWTEFEALARDYAAALAARG